LEHQLSDQYQTKIPLKCIKSNVSEEQKFLPSSSYLYLQEMRELIFFHMFHGVRVERCSIRERAILLVLPWSSFE